MRIEKETQRKKEKSMKINLLLLVYGIIFVMVLAYFFITILGYKTALENYRNIKNADENLSEEIRQKEEILKKLKKMNEATNTKNTVAGDGQE